MSDKPWKWGLIHSTGAGNLPEGTKEILVEIQAPPGVKIRVARNPKKSKWIGPPNRWPVAFGIKALSRKGPRPSTPRCSRCGAKYREDPSCGKSIHDTLPHRPKGKS